MYIILLKPNQHKSLPERINECGVWGHKTGIKHYMFILSTYTGILFP